MVGWQRDGVYVSSELVSVLKPKGVTQLMHNAGCVLELADAGRIIVEVREP
jgi:hypothetical protein